MEKCFNDQRLALKRTISREAKQLPLTSILSPQAGRGGFLRRVGLARRREKAVDQFSFEGRCLRFRRECIENICFNG
jgi:hypothetical protein